MSTITTINATDAVGDSRSVLNTNLANLNTDKIEADSTDTLTNKTLTAPVVNSPTGIVKGDVGLGNVDNTSDATKAIAFEELRNKTFNADNNTVTNIGASEVESGLITDQTAKSAPIAADTLLVSDSADSDNLKKVSIANLPISGLLYTSDSFTGASSTQYSFTHNLGLTEADVISGRYKVFLTGTFSGDRGQQWGDTLFSASEWGTEVSHYWSATAASVAGQVNHQANEVKIRLSTSVLGNARLHIKKVY